VPQSNSQHDRRQCCRDGVVSTTTSRQPVCYCRTSHHGVFPSGEFIVQFETGPDQSLWELAQAPNTQESATHRSRGGKTHRHSTVISTEG
jgi:hypothetical protein